MGIKGQEEGRTLCSRFTAFLYEFRDASKSPLPPLLMVSHDCFRVDNISLLSCVESMSSIWEDTLILGMHRGWISAFVLLAYKSSLQGRELPPEKLRFFFIIMTQIIDLEIRRTMKRQRSNFVQQIIFECLLGGLGILSDARKSEENH